ncbi:hypothetical protein H6P81_006599 [Aristolochia fimbriata]|uniref:Uncharacterized protein n=1 Tax=Aristolochia fimbriata TaxID=158543 RepID=A0AAV7EXR4_ARIFI|nr:hypothetical protein H6P81_006599 [Aristolochia fimbriata]
MNFMRIPRSLGIEGESATAAGDHVCHSDDMADTCRGTQMFLLYCPIQDFRCPKRMDDRRGLATGTRKRRAGRPGPRQATSPNRRGFVCCRLSFSDALLKEEKGDVDC